MNPLTLFARLVVDVFALALAGFLAWHFAMLARVLWLLALGFWRNLRGSGERHGFEVLLTPRNITLGSQE